MPFIRYSRDRRGYESTVVMHAYRASQGPPRTRVLYFFRSPSNVKIGRRPLDPEVMEALEHTHPDLTFDWTSLQREPSQMRAELRERPERWRARSEPPAARLAPEPPPVVIVDESLLGRAIGAIEAARLRARYNELMQRIARRARTPEDRDRLIERAARLNPDEWSDEPAIRAAVTTVEAEWNAILGELPQRRRGRRGGRVRNMARPEPSGRGPDIASAGPPASAILDDEGHEHEEQDPMVDSVLAGQDPDAGDSGHGGGFGSDPGTATGSATDPSSDPGSAAEPDPSIPGGGDGPLG